MMAINDSLNLRAIHDQIHSQVLSRRQDTAFWEGLFETAWAGYILAHHAPENRQDEIVNSIKGEILGEKRLKDISKPYDLASCYMIAAFLDSIGVKDDATDFVGMAENFVETNLSSVEWQERFHFYTTPEYVYAACLCFDQMPGCLSQTSIATLQQATAGFCTNQWYNRSQIYALAGSAYLCLSSFQPQDCVALAQFALHFQAATLEDNIALLWFLETNWEHMREAIADNTDLAQQVDFLLVDLRTRIFRFFPNFVIEPFDLEQGRTLTTMQQLERVASDRMVSTIELLMLDEVAERHAVSALVVTKEEWARRDTISTLFDQYRVRVDGALENLGLTNTLEAIYHSLDSDNPASWSQAALSCRHVLYELSHTLLQVPDKTYLHLKGRDDQPMSLAKDKEKNRLEAYMHQIGVRSRNPLVVEQLNYLSDLMRRLFDEAAATGKHRPGPGYEETCSVVLHTYLFLGELERLTKFEVVTGLK